MTTATKPKKITVSAQLRKLEEARDAALTVAREARRERDAFDEQTRELQAHATAHRNGHPEQYAGGDFRPKPDTDAAKLAQSIRDRLQNRNPHLSDYELAQANFLELAQGVEDFKRDRVADRIALVLGDATSSAKIREGAELLREGLDEYRAEVDVVRGIILDTPTLQRVKTHTLSFDARAVEQWWPFVLDLLEALDEDGVLAPGLTPYAIDRVTNLGR